MKSAGVRRTKYALFSRHMGALDWEYEGFTGPNIEGCYMDPDGEQYFFTDPEDMFYKIIDTPRDEKGHRQSVIVWAHNGEGADFPRMMEPMTQFAQELGADGTTASVVAQGAQKYIAVIFRIPDGNRHYTVIFADSMAVCPTSLEKMAEALAPHALKKGHCPDHDFTQGGPWYDPSCPVCHDYLAGDVSALWYSMHKLKSLLRAFFRVPICLTNGAIALKFWKTTIPEGHTYFRLAKHKERWLTEPGMTAKHGGFVWPGHQRGYRGPAVTYDRSGAYAHQLRQGVPSGLAMWTRTFRDDVPGVYEVTAHVPADINIPVVPRSGDGPLYPTGVFRTRVTNRLIRYAEKLGCTFEIHRGIIWPKLEYPFEEFVGTCERIEYPADGSEPSPAMKLIIKLMRNSLIGKFGSNPVTEKPYLGVIPGEGGTPYTDPVTGDPLPVWHRPEEISEAAHILPHWNIWVTDGQRIDLHRVLDAGGEGAYYGDTDSITMNYDTAAALIAKGILDVGIGYGKYHGEGLWAHLYVGGPKNKFGWLLDEKTGEYKWHSTAKGVPKKQRHANGDLQVMASYGEVPEDGGKMAWDSPHSFRSRLLNPSAGYGQVRQRSFSRLENSASWTVGQDNRIRPVHLEEK